MLKNRLAPSVFAGNFADMKSVLVRLEEAGVDLIHYDVMDNHFVPNISFGPKFMADLCRATHIPGDAHLMIGLEGIFQKKQFEAYLNLPLENITVHLEATQNYISDVFTEIRAAGKIPGISIKPKTPVESLVPYLDEVGLVLLMSVEPGFSGQKFMPEVIERVEMLRELCAGREIDIQVDGGVCRENYKELISAGATNLVMGSAFFRDENPAELAEAIHRA